MKKIAQFVYSVSSLGLMAFASPALAQQASDGQAQSTALPATDAQAPAAPAPATVAPAPATQSGQGEIVVTGSRLREESVQETPVAVSVVNNRLINDLHATDITALATIAPSLNISYNPTGNSVPFISLRGFVVVTTEISTEPGVSVYIDGIYQPTISGSLSELYDVERVEVLRGPQSALLGKSSSAGALLIRRIRPSDHFDANIEATYGTDNLFQTQGRVTFPIIPGILSAHVYGLYRHRDDYVDNQFPGGHDVGGENTYEMRGALRFTPTPYVDWYLSAQYDHRRPSQAPVRSIAPITFAQCTFYHDCTNDAGQIRIDNTDDSLPSRQREFDLVSELNVDMSGMRLTSLTGYREFHYLNNSDVDGTPYPLLNVNNQTTDSLADSQEVRFSSIHNGGWDFNGRLAWLIGAFYNHGNILLEEPHVQYNGTATPTSNDAGQRSIRDGYALFGHLDFDITDKLTVSFGGRQSWDHVRHLYSFRAVGTTVPNPLPNSQEASFQNFSIEAGAQYKFNDHVMGYLRYAEGYRSGGFIGLPGSAAVAAIGYGPETSRSYEAGLRSELFNRKLLFNLTIYNTEFQNLQRSESVPSPTAGFVVVTGNVASARTRGVELETVWRPVQGLNIRGTLGYIDPVYTDYTNNGVDLSNTRFSFAPRWTVSLDPSYEFRIGSGLFDTMRVQGQWAYKSTYLAAAQDIPEFTQHGYSQVDASITLTGGHNTRYSISAFVQNAFNQNYLVYGTVAAPLFEILFDNPGRRWGITAAVHF